MTGPLLSPPAATAPPGHPFLEISPSALSVFGFYGPSGHEKKIPTVSAFAPYLDVEVGFNKFLGAELIAAFQNGYSGNRSATYWIDTIFRFGFQVSNDDSKSWVPDFRLLFQETFPTGNYQKFNPLKNLADYTGQGAYYTGGFLAYQKLFTPQKDHPFRLNLSIGYLFPTSFRVKGFNIYGGNADTKGVVHPGNYLSSFFCTEYGLSRTWALALEGNYFRTARGNFSRKSGPEINVPTSYQFSLAPEIQHTFSKNLGVILTYWFTVSGQNSYAFRSLSLTALYLF